MDIKKDQALCTL